MRSPDPPHPEPRTRLALFARTPEPGFVKTRLIGTLGRDGAAELHRAMVSDALQAVAGTAAERRLLFLLQPERDGGAAPCALPLDWQDVAGIELREQRGAGLGERLSAAFDELLEALVPQAPGSAPVPQVPRTRAVIVGSDCPTLDSAALCGALDRLRDHDLVLGPAADGGYVLIGLARSCPALFQGVPWGTERVLERTLAHAQRAGLKAHLLPTHADVDTAADVIGLLEGWARGLEHAPRTRAALQAMGLAPG